MEAHDQTFYDIVAEELRSRFIVDGLWVRAFSDAGGDEAKAKAIYIAYRVEQLKAEVLAAKKAAFERAQADARREREERDRAHREEADRRAREEEIRRQNAHPFNDDATVLSWTLAGLIVFIAILLIVSTGLK